MKLSSAHTAALAAIGLACLPTTAHAHVTLETATAKIGSSYKAVLRVPHGCNGQATYALRVTIPGEIANVKPMPKSGWQLTTKTGPYAAPFNNHGTIMREGVKEITWSSGNLPDAYYDEFVFTGTIIPGATARTVYIPVVQECANGENRWIETLANTTSARLKAPAPRLQLVAGEMAQNHSAHQHGHAAGSPDSMGKSKQDTGKLYTLGALKISAPWTRATPKGAKVAGGYVKITNTGTTADRLTGGTFPNAGRIEVHEMAIEDSIMRMRHLAKGLEIKPGQTVELKPSGYHLMFMQLRAPVVAGTPIKGTLVFEKAGTIEIEYQVAPIGARQMPASGGHDNHGHDTHGHNGHDHGAQNHAAQSPAKPAADPANAGAAHAGAEHHHHGTRFDDAARWTKTFDDPKRDAWQKPHEVLMALNLKPADIVADIGAGTGYLSVRIANHVKQGKVYASDISKSMVDFLKKRAGENKLANLHAVHGSETSPNLPEAVDVAILLDVYHHIGQRSAYFRNLKSSLKPGARIIIIDFRPEAKQGAPKHMRLPVSTVDEEMQAAGFGRTASHDFLPHQYMLEYTATK